MLLPTCLVIWGCKPAKQPQPSPPAGADRVHKPDGVNLAADEPVLIDSLASGSAGDNMPTSDADAAWRGLVELMQTPDPPDEWLIKEPSRADGEEFKRKSAEQLGKAAEKARDFYSRFPQHENAAEARQQEYNLLSMAVQLGATNRIAQLQKLESEKLTDPSLSENDKLELRIQQLQRTALADKGTNRVAALSELDKGVRALQTQFPSRSEPAALALSVAENWLEENEPARSRALANDLLKGAAEPEVKEAARGLLKKLDRLGQPLQLKFTALDGRETDLEKLKGKVVLVDFWATWCRPCMAELPNVKAAYEQLHPKGFEIIGISFDQDKAALEGTVAREKVSWPQYFEVNPESHKLGEHFGVSSIPSMWLVDKKGVLRDLNAREKLAAKVEKLLAE